MPATTDFTVKVNGSPVGIASVVLIGSTVQLALDNPVIDTDVVTVSYTFPGPATGIADIHGNYAASITDEPVANLTDSGGPPLPPPSADKRYAPPTLVSPVTIHVNNANANSVCSSLSNSQDYQLVCDEVLNTLLHIQGGRNIIGYSFEWNITNSSSDVYWDHTALAIKAGANNRIVHFEGALAQGSTMNDGFVCAAVGTIIQLQTCYIGPNAAVGVYHPDCFQAQGDYAELRADKITMETELQGWFLGDHDAGANEPLGATYISRCNIKGTPGRYLFWKSDNRNTSPVVVLENCYLDAPSNTLGSDMGLWVYPDSSRGDFIDYPWPDNPSGLRRAVTSGGGTFVSWTGTNITGGWTKGAPPGGDFVPKASVGLGYVP